MNLEKAGYTLNNLGKINIILGKNGCGKSTLMRKVEQSIQTNVNGYGKVKYITPERGGTLIYEAGIDQNTSSQKWLIETRRKNQFDRFREQSVAQFHTLETLFLRELESRSDLRTESSRRRLTPPSSHTTVRAMSHTAV